MYGYVYKTTNLINSKIYIGQHKSDKFVGNKYLGSGSIFRKAVEKYGKENFNVELLKECFSQEDLDNQEVYYISLLNSTDINIGYNLSLGGKSGSSTPELNRQRSNTLIGHEVSQETKNKISSTKKKYYQTQDGINLKKHLSEINKGKEPGNKGKTMTEEQLQKTREAHQPGWYKHKEETKQQISNTLKERYASWEIIQHEGVGKKKCKNLDTNEIFDSLASAAKKYGIKNPSYIAKQAEGKYKTCGGYHWKLI